MSKMTDGEMMLLVSDDRDASIEAFLAFVEDFVADDMLDSAWDNLAIERMYQE